MLGEVQQLRRHHLDEPFSVMLSAVLDHVLRDVVAVFVEDQGRAGGEELVEDPPLSALATVFEHALDDAAAVGVRRENVNLSGEGVDDELDVLQRNPFDRLLHHVIAVLVFDTLQHVRADLPDERGLLVDQHVLERLRSNVRRTCCDREELSKGTVQPTFCTTLHP